MAAIQQRKDVSDFQPSDRCQNLWCGGNRQSKATALTALPDFHFWHSGIKYAFILNHLYDFEHKYDYLPLKKKKI